MLNHLSGVRVLDVGRMLPSGVVGFELAKLGADVVKVEIPPHGDYLRDNPPFIVGRGDLFLDPNRNKRSIGLAVNTEEGKKLYLELAAQADVIIAAAKPGAYDKLGIGYETIKALNPGVIYCDMTGYGQTGPYRDLPAHGTSVDLAAGVVLLEERDGVRRFFDGHVPISPRISGLNAAVGVLGSLYRKQATGEGEYLDVSQFDCAVVFGFRDMIQFANNGRRGPTISSYGPRYGIQVVKDGKEMLFAIPENRLWRKFSQALGRPDLEAYASDDPMQYDNPPGLQEAMAEVALLKTTPEWLDFAQEVGVPISPYVPVEDLPTNEHIAARNMLVKVPSPSSGEEILMSGSAVKYGSAEVEWKPAPELGADSLHVLKDYGIDEGRIEALMSSGTVKAPEGA